MIKVLSFFKKTLKAILWLVLIFVFLFLIVAGIIQIPAVQNKIVHTATTFVSDKTHTKVEIKNVSISFPKSVVLEGLYLEDLQKDTLIYAREVKINIVLKDLLYNKICINNFTLKDLTVNLHNTQSDSLFNYNFLLTAFADTTKQVKDKSATAVKWTFTVDNVNLKNIKLRYNDDFGGMNVSAGLDNLELQMKEIDFDKSIFNIKNLLVEKLNAHVLMKKSSKTDSNKANSILPKILANNIQINNSTVTYDDLMSKQTILAVINRFELKKGVVDLEKELVTSDKIYLAESEVHYFSSDIASVPLSNTKIPAVTAKSDWKVSVKKIHLDDNTLIYKVGDKPANKNAFDAGFMQFHQLSLKASNLYYSSNKTSVTVDKFNGVDQNNFAITRFETVFSMDNHSITAKNITAKTTHSAINADMNIRYSSLKSLVDSLPYLVMNINIRNAALSNSDILYFTPQLNKQAFFNNRTNISTVSGFVNGRLNNLKVKNLIVKTGVKTVLASDFNIIGLPNAETAFFDFPNLKLISGKHDIEILAGTTVPKSINLPENIALGIVFKGKLKSFISTIVLISSYGGANIAATIDPKENFTANMNINDFDLGSLLKNKDMYGPVSLSVQVDGQGLDSKTMQAKIKADVSEIYLNKYTYHNLVVDGNVNKKEFTGKINLNDKNAVIDFDGLVNMNPDQERYRFHLNVQGADLQKLNFSKNDLRIGLDASADLKGGTVDKLNGKVGISNLIITQNGKKYMLDSVLVASINELNKSEFNFSSALVGLKYTGTISPTSLPTVLTQFINNYFPFSETKPTKTKSEPSNFNFEIQLHNHPILSEILLPQLKEFEPGIITGSFDSQKKVLKLNANMKRIVYGTTEMNDLAVNVNADSTALKYLISSTSIGNSQINFSNFLFEGKLANNKIVANVSSIDNNKNKKLLIQSQITKNKANYRLTLDPKEFYLMNNRWDIAADNYVEFGSKGFLIHHLFMNNNQSQLNIASVNDRFYDDLNIAIKNFKLEDIAGIVQKDSSLAKGDVDGNVLLKRVNSSYGIIADAKITNLFVRNVPIGNLVVKAENPTTERFNLNAILSGTENNLTATGYFIPNGGNNSLHIKGDIQSLSMKTVEAFSMGQVSQASGNLSGNFLLAGRTDAPDITGELTFNNAFLNPSYLNNRYELKHETVQLKTDGIYFKDFTLLDATQHKAVIDGKVKMKNFSDYNFDLQVNARNFSLFNTTVRDNKEFYGRMIVDSKIDLKGPMALPVVNAKIKLKKGSNFTFAVPEDKQTTDKGEDVVEFNDIQNFNSILYRNDKKVIKKSGLKGFDLSSIIEVDKEATLRLLMDPTSSDSLVVRGDAALSFTMDRSGKMSLTGAYNLSDGSYLISIESVIKRRFEIIAGSTIVWNGDPLDADISLNASYTVRAAPFDLVADQMAGLSDVEQGGYKQMYPFIVLLKLRGAILKPEITFEIQLSPENKGILGGAVNQKLNMLNEDPSLLNKQVFALLVLGRFVQENPLQAESTGASTLLRSTISNFLSAQLNQLSSKIVPGMSLNFDIQSYNDFQTGQAQGRTQMEIGLKQELFNQRLSVQLGGTIDVEGEKAKQNSASEITSDVTVEYKMTKDGRFRLKGFRHNLYDGAIEGQIIETGVGGLYVRDFNKWKEFFKKPVKYKKTTPNP